jgi:zinc and cadmium transporter
MSPLAQVALYSLVIFVGAVVGAVLPLWFRRRTPLVTLLAFAAGVMFGAAFFHMLPEAYERGGLAAFSFAPLGFVVLFVLERYVLTHVCEEPPECAEHAHGAAFGLTAFLGLSAHTVFDGVAIAAASTEGAAVGLSAFVAVVAHKIPSSFSLAAILQSEGRQAKSVVAYVGALGLMVPLGAAVYFALGSSLHLTAFAPRALAFSAGTFLYIAVSDLLPHVNRHGKDRRLANVASLALGLAVMFALSAAMHEPH